MWNVAVESRIDRDTSIGRERAKDRTTTKLQNMDVAVLVSIAAGLVALIVLLTLLSRKKTDKNEAAGGPPARAQPLRRAAGVRNARRRMQDRQHREPPDEANDASDEDENVEPTDKPEMPEGKLGAKKRAKLEAKAERKQQREALEREREERKKREQQAQEESDKRREKERLEELAQEEADKKAREERERIEQEEYLKMKEAFSVEEEGYDVVNEEEQKNLLQEFLDYIKATKVVVLEDLAGHFNMKTQSVIERIQDLQANGRLTGVIDDRGKFIYISQEELESVAKFVKQRGRVSIAELAENSNRLINLNSEQTKAVETS
ncbi:DDRGK domain-containing protein 1 [Diachasma alloeum]|uniref:DDRGK domain-containing protein 1 n=1 Tax=Diachasma alloeum TaxID=454923 RepID=UPI00073831EE|nr:DDRGK domain-containing protein 1 [Diachasma alloeum]